MSLQLEQLLKKLLKFRKDRDWEQFHSPKNLAISLSIEAAELLELFQWRPEDETLSPEKLQKVQNEMADVFIYLLLMSNDLGIDLYEASLKKIEMNGRKYPVDKAKGCSLKYTEL